MTEKRWVRLDGGPEPEAGRMIEIEPSPIRLDLAASDADDPEGLMWVYSHVGPDGIPVFTYQAPV